MSAAIRQAAADLFALDERLAVVDRFQKFPTPLARTGQGYLEAKKHFALVRMAEEVKTKLLPMVENAKRALLAAVDEDDRGMTR